MKFTVLLCLSLCVVAAFAEPLPCIGRPCNRSYKPVCGERFVDGRLERKMFGNSCTLQSANDCGAGYQECTPIGYDEK